MNEFDEKFENSGWRLFLRYFQDFYTYEFEELSKEYKDEVIEYVLMNNSEVFNRADVLKENLCVKCGRCCRELDCPYLDDKTNLCTIHDNPEAKVCKEYPWDDEIGFALTLNCGYQKRFVKKYLDNYFTTAIKLMRGELNGEEEK